MSEQGGLPDWKVSDFDYDLPPELIAQTPLVERDRSRLLVVDRRTNELVHSTIDRLGDWLQPGDTLVANNSKVIAARIYARKADTGGRVEFLLLRPQGERVWEALARPVRRLSPGTRLTVEAPDADNPSHVLTVTSVGEAGSVIVDLPVGVSENLERFGQLPLPPYIKTRLADANRYQTVYGSVPGSVAAPTAGLHFTQGLIDRLQASGLGWCEVTLHIGLDTFRPVTADLVADHVIHREWCSVGAEAKRTIFTTKQRGGRIVAIGTTAARTLETLGRSHDAANHDGFTAMTDLFIVPGYRWSMVDAMLTNFHLPRSTLLMMISAFAGKDLIERAYREAIHHRYRFFSFGDAMLIL